MKKLLTLLACAFGVVLLTNNASFAQASASASANATIVTPISIANTAPLSFGNIALNGTSGGSVTIQTSTGSAVRSSTGGITIPNQSNSFTAAAFTVSGSGTYTYTISLPTTATLTGPSAATMTIGTFNSYPTVGTGGTLTAGTQNLLVGGVLTVSGTQATGSYTNASAFNVTVNYN